MLPLTNRMKEVLKIVVEDYTFTAEPVSSMTISRKSGLQLSPATIRNIMSELEEMGFLLQPHTSAGRVPTERGYRFYVDYLLDINELSSREKREIRSRYTVVQSEVKDLFRETCRMLSTSSNCLGVVWAPRLSELILQHIELVKLRNNLTLAILVSTTGIVQNRIVEMDEDLSRSDLEHLSDNLNKLLSGLTLQQVREKLFSQMRMEKHAYDRLYQQTIKLGGKAFSSFDETDVFIEGRTNILSEPEFGNISTMTNLFRAFEEKTILVKLLDKCMAPRGVQISIGSESQVQQMETCSLVTSTYGCEGRIWGALGVIGPRRMNYSRIIPLVDYSARLLSEILDTYYH
ncbi:MAG: heat-inducible transcription repressor HrcA [Deltaproteobacteria bacterium]|nr:heat-inducible transcription repressor HrcA [Deltaproteobacteria bacterium]